MGKNRFEAQSGPSQRQLRVAELIRRTLAEALARGELHDPEIAHMSITVGEVRATPDLRKATVFVLPLGGQDSDVAIALLNRNKGELRRLLARSVHLKYSPELNFVADQTFDQMDETRRLMEQDVVQRDLAKPDSDGV